MSVYALYGSFLAAKLISWGIYSLALFLFIPNEIIAEQIQYLLFIELFYGMLLYPLKISIIKTPDKKFSFFIWSIIFSIVGILISLYFFRYNISLLILLGSLTLFPVFILINASGEIYDIDKFVLKENKAAIFSTIICATIFSISYYIEIFTIVSTLYRSIITSVLIVFFNRNIWNKILNFSNNKLSLNFIETLAGIDYLLVSYFLKSTVFHFITLGHYGSITFPLNTIKMFTIAYDPIAAILGLVLRRRFIMQGHQSYILKTKKFFLYLAILTSLLLPTVVLINELYFFILSIIFIFIAAFSNTAQLTSYKRRICIIILIISIGLLMKNEVINFYSLFFIPLLMLAVVYIPTNKQEKYTY